MWRNQLGFQGFDPMFQPLYYRQQAAELGQSWKSNAGREFALWRAGHRVDHRFEATRLLLRADEGQGSQTRIHGDAPVSFPAA
jgi:inosine/xanthosine triphosphate pyrophosphatase family protein